MTLSNPEELAQRAESIYNTLRSTLEAAHADEFVAIEPLSEEYFLGDTLSQAIGAARQSHPDRLVHAIRIGHTNAIHLGARLV